MSPSISNNSASPSRGAVRSFAQCCRSRARSAADAQARACASRVGATAAARGRGRPPLPPPPSSPPSRPCIAPRAGGRGGGPSPRRIPARRRGVAGGGRSAARVPLLPFSRINLGQKVWGGEGAASRSRGRGARGAHGGTSRRWRQPPRGRGRGEPPLGRPAPFLAPPCPPQTILGFTGSPARRRMSSRGG